MTNHSQVVNETLRISNIPPGLFRKALKDFQVKGTLPILDLKSLRFTSSKLFNLIDRSSAKFPGYTVPAGWTVMLVTPATQLNPDTFKDPVTFNPWRWQVGLFTVTKP
jgi:cytochrome P450